MGYVVCGCYLYSVVGTKHITEEELLSKSWKSVETFSHNLTRILTRKIILILFKMSGGPFKFQNSPNTQSMNSLSWCSVSPPGLQHLATLNITCSALLTSPVTHRRFSENSKPDEICKRIYKLDSSVYVQNNLHA